jgi:alpha-L-rhamnosidase
VLGARPVSPGYKTWLIEPQAGDLSWAKGRVPTPYGPITVRWDKDRNGLKLKVFVPAGTSGTVGLPASSGGASLTDNDRPAQQAKKALAEGKDGLPGYIYLENIGPGAHLIQVK